MRLIRRLLLDGLVAVRVEIIQPDTVAPTQGSTADTGAAEQSVPRAGRRIDIIITSIYSDVHVVPYAIADGGG
jgi:hypothetical protein